VVRLYFEQFVPLFKDARRMKKKERRKKKRRKKEGNEERETERKMTEINKINYNFFEPVKSMIRK